MQLLAVGVFGESDEPLEKLVAVTFGALGLVDNQIIHVQKFAPG